MTIKQKAEYTLHAHSKGDMRYIQLLLTMQVRTGLSTTEIEHRIKELASE